jgi:hypothetical protein
MMSLCWEVSPMVVREVVPTKAKKRKGMRSFHFRLRLLIVSRSIRFMNIPMQAFGRNQIIDH